MRTKRVRKRPRRTHPVLLAGQLVVFGGHRHFVRMPHEILRLERISIGQHDRS